MMNRTCPVCGAPPGGGCRGGDVHETRVLEWAARTLESMRAEASALGNMVDIDEAKARIMAGPLKSPGTGEEQGT